MNTNTITVGSTATGVVEFDAAYNGRTMTGAVKFVDATDHRSVRVVTATGLSVFLRLPAPRRAR